MHAVRRRTPGMCRRRSAFENHAAAAAFGGGGQACSCFRTVKPKVIYCITYLTRLILFDVLLSFIYYYELVVFTIATIPRNSADILFLLMCWYPSIMQYVLRNVRLDSILNQNHLFERSDMP